MLRGHEGRGRCVHGGRGDGTHRARQLRDDVPHQSQGLAAAVLLPEEQPELHDRPDLVQPELERGHHTEVAAASADRPEQLRVLVGVGVQQAAVGDDHVRREQVVHGQTAEPGEPAHPAAQGEPADAGVTDQPHGDGEPVRLGRGVDVGHQGPALHASAARRPGRR